MLALGAGVASGLAFLTRPEGLMMGLLVLGWLVAGLVSRRLNLRRSLAIGAAFALGALLVSSPYLAAMRSEEGSFTLSRKKSVSALLLLEGPVRGQSWGSEVNYDKVLSRLAGSFRECAYDGYRAFLPVIPVPWSRRCRVLATRFLASYIGLFAIMLFLVHYQNGYLSRRHWMSCVALGMPLGAFCSSRMRCARDCPRA